MVIAVASANAWCEPGSGHHRPRPPGARSRGCRTTCRRDLAGARRRKRTTDAAISATAPCFVCQVAGRNTASYLRELCREDRAPEIEEMALDGGTPHRCLPHVNVGLGDARSKDEAERLIEIYRAGEATLRRQLAEFIRKRDYRFHEERMTTGEAEAYARAMRLLVGDRAGSGGSTRSEAKPKEVQRSDRRDAVGSLQHGAGDIEQRDESADRALWRRSCCAADVPRTRSFQYGAGVTRSRSGRSMLASGASAMSGGDDWTVSRS